ncbi:MAG: YmL10 [Sclerophora amabilis]|nr:MAG: YmL10 [Sclerophora amabilis]
MCTGKGSSSDQKDMPSRLQLRRIATEALKSQGHVILQLNFDEALAKTLFLDRAEDHETESTDTFYTERRSTMPSSLNVIRASLQQTRPLSSLLTPFLLPCLPQLQQQRSASILSSLSDNPSAYSRRIRRGRGPSSGKGKTSGRGHKGQKQHGKVPSGLQGGQTSLEVVKGKRGFENVFSVEMTPLNLDRVQSWIDQGRLDPSKPITMKELADSRCLHGVKDGVKVLGRGADELKTPINLLVSRASASAIRAIESAGGVVTTRFYTPNSIRRILRGQSDAGASSLDSTATASSSTAASHSPVSDTLSSPSPSPPSLLSTPFSYRLPDPTSRKDIEYYRDPAHRGYLSHLVPDGEGPSLFFKTPGKKRDHGERKDVKGPGSTGKRAGENRLW